MLKDSSAIHYPTSWSSDRKGKKSLQSDSIMIKKDNQFYSKKKYLFDVDTNKDPLHNRIIFFFLFFFCKSYCFEKATTEVQKYSHMTISNSGLWGSCVIKKLSGIYSKQFLRQILPLK
jgi:hypothetical protein